MHNISSGQSITARGSHQNARRRFSLDSQDEVVPFYMKKKYDHHLDEKRRRLLGRRKTLTLEDERYLFEKQLMGPSADLGTVSFKSGVDRSWLNADLRKEREEAVKRMSEFEIEIACKQRPSSGIICCLGCFFAPKINTVKPMFSFVQNSMQLKASRSVCLFIYGWCRQQFYTADTNFNQLYVINTKKVGYMLERSS